MMGAPPLPGAVAGGGPPPPPPPLPGAPPPLVIQAGSTAPPPRPLQWEVEEGECGDALGDTTGGARQAGQAG